MIPLTIDYLSKQLEACGIREGQTIIVHCSLIYKLGQATVRFMKQRPLVDWAIHWMEQHRR
ncbi:MAG: hypothetical protein QNJ72_36985 [Pleurocapsa sp. MO_226.B13]|nr:hypothetical protein [Pleurocapsa sp. MO_226.B13]